MSPGAREGAGAAAARPGRAATGLDLEAFARAIAAPSDGRAGSWRPWIVRLAPGELGRFRDLCEEHHLMVLDPVERQLEDLASVRLPAAGRVERAAFVAEVVRARGGRDTYGSWVYLPWARKVVHVLEAEDYFAVVTDRNRDKLTREEQRLLRSKRIGVMGLSVGGEAAVTLAQEHLCGEIVLADFDHLDLSNLNRLAAGIDELGVNKAVVVARRIARLDPYLRVSIFEEGVSEKNVEHFLDGLDLLVEECDGLDMKYRVRQLAKARGLDVVFAADERGFLSVEPYSRAADLPVFHGRIAGPQPPRDTFTTPLAFLRALTEWMGGWSRISERSRRSLERVGRSLSGYPQLASETRWAAGQIGHVARRLLLGEPLPPFIRHLDLTDLIPSSKDPPASGH